MSDEAGTTLRESIDRGIVKRWRVIDHITPGGERHFRTNEPGDLKPEGSETFGLPRELVRR